MENYEDHIVLVDDDETISAMHKKILQKAGYQNIKQLNSVGGLLRYLEDSLLVGNPVDLILMDIRMPDQDGLVGCKQVQKYEHFKDIPIIMLTSVNDPDILEAAFKNGAMDYMTKTAPAVEFKARVRSALSLKHERDNRKAREQELLKLTQSLLAKQTEQQQLSYLDPLTKLYNRKGFEKKLEMEWLNAYRQDHVLTLLLIGVDHFDQYNIEYTREQGDDCLKQVAQSFSTVREKTFAARLGGGEFMILLPGGETDEDFDPLSYAEDLRHAVMTLNIPHETSPVEPCITVSIGVAIANPRNCPGTAIFIQASEKALEEAKNAGRNQAFLVKAEDPDLVTE